MSTEKLGWWKHNQKWSTRDLLDVILVEESDGKSYYVVTDRHGRRCKMRRCSTITRTLGKEGLQFWTAARAADAAVNLFPTYSLSEGQEEFSATPEGQDFRKRVYEASDLALTRAASRGTRAHRMIERWHELGRPSDVREVLAILEEGVTGQLGDPSRVADTSPADRLREWRMAFLSVVQWVRWWIKTFGALGDQGHQIEEVHAEVVVADLELGYAGTMDLAVRCRGNLWLFIDWKTSTAPHAVYDMALAAYVNAWAKMGKFVLPSGDEGPEIRAYVVRAHTPLPWEEGGLAEDLSKVQADLETWCAFRSRTGFDTVLTAFGACLHLHEWLEQRNWNTGLVGAAEEKL